MPQTLLSESLVSEFEMPNRFIPSVNFGEDDLSADDNSIYNGEPALPSMLAKYYQSEFGRDLCDAAVHRSLATESNIAILKLGIDLKDYAPTNMAVNDADDYSDEDPLCIEVQFEDIVKIKWSLYREIYRIYSESSVSDWDGYDAIPISENTFSKALKLAQLLPDDLPLPEVIPEPTGEIAFEWYQDKTHVFVISVGEENVISYAGLFGVHSQTHGSEYFTHQLPLLLTSHISRLSI